MGPGANWSTDLSLLSRLRRNPTDQTAWGQFVARYGQTMENWCRRWGLQESDAKDVVQNVLLDLSRQMKEQSYKRTGRFRGWLKTVAYRAWCDFLRRRQDPALGAGDSAVLRVLNSVEAREDFLKHLDEECERELLELAMARVQARVQQHTWLAFRLTALEGLSGSEAAQRLNMKVATVFVARSKVQKMLREEMQLVDADDTPS